MYDLLLVEDEAIERETLKLFIRRHDLDIGAIWEAGNGQEALELCRKHPVALIILDINLPVMDGLTFLEKARSEGLKSKALVSSAYSQFEFAVRAMQCGAGDFLVKPVSEELLVSALEKMIERLKQEEAEKAAVKQIGDYLKVSQSVLATVPPEDSDEATTLKVKRYIEAHYSERIGLDEIAEATGYSKFTISRIFKNVTGDSVVSYLIDYRMQKAKELLSMTHEPVRIVAFRVGYSDPNYFTWTFKKQEGLSPLAYRAKALKQRFGER